MFFYKAELIEELNDAELFQNEESFDPKEIKEDAHINMNEDKDHLDDENKEIVQDKIEEEKEENDSSDDTVNILLFYKEVCKISMYYIRTLSLITSLIF